MASTAANVAERMQEHGPISTHADPDFGGFLPIACRRLSRPPEDACLSSE